MGRRAQPSQPDKEMMTTYKRYLFAGLGLLALAGALALPVFAELRIGGPGGPVTTMDAAMARANEALAGAASSDLKVAEVMEFSNHFYVLVKEINTGIGALELIVERDGFVHPEPPSMMWNTKYGHMAGYSGMGGMMGYIYGPGPGESNQTAQPSIAIERARQIATQFLAAVFPGAAPDDGTTLYGYFTFDIKRDGTPIGMLSVNAYSGQVWYHNWHGTFVQEKEF